MFGTDTDQVDCIVGKKSNQITETHSISREFELAQMKRGDFN